MSNDNLNIGDMLLEKGLIRKNVRMFAWDVIPECEAENCQVYHLCKYIKQGRCAVMVQYLKALYDCILGNYKNLDDVSLFKIGMQLIPLYVQLAKMQLVEMSVPSPIYETDKGAIVSHPIYREIRETLKTINMMWKDLEITIPFSDKPSLDDMSGNPDYYENMSKNNKPQKGVIR